MNSPAGFRPFSARWAVTAAGLTLIGIIAGVDSAPTAAAAPDPCAASEVAKTVAEVATYTGNYLEANPKANAAITAISQKPSGPESVAALTTYFDANPKVAADLQRLQQPLVTLSRTCTLPVTLPQLFGLMQAAAQAPVPPAQP